METRAKQKVNIAEQIKKWRKEKDMSQEALARKADIPLTTLVKVETEVIKKPSINFIMKVAEALEVTIDKLLYK
jgi:XRE family transcriptional regulator, master regulator for biofilm formation